jgi:hypothetical protein
MPGLPFLAIPTFRGSIDIPLAEMRLPQHLAHERFRHVFPFPGICNIIVVDLHIALREQVRRQPR